LIFLTGLVLATARDLPAGPSSISPNLNDHGTFEISIAGQKVGTEKFEILSARDGFTASAELELRVEEDGKTLVFHTFPELVLDSRLRPLAYRWDQKGSSRSGLSIDFSTSPARVRYRTVNGKTDNREFVLPKNVVVLDDNVLDQYELLVWLYDRTSRGAQTFRAFTPQEALPGQVNVVESGPGRGSVRGVEASLRRLTVTTDLAYIDLWVDGRERLQRVSIPAAQFGAVRQR
jgi:hypothetical protein